jgi:hypothetical protein
MTKEEFEELHQICKDAWLALADDPSRLKYKLLGKFDSYNNCPACYVAACTTGKDPVDSCHKCPVKVWRHFARKSEDAACQIHGEYGYWRLYGIIGQPEKAAKVAKVIAELEWEWMDEYADVELVGLEEVDDD